VCVLSIHPLLRPSNFELTVMLPRATQSAVRTAHASQSGDWRPRWTRPRASAIRCSDTRRRAREGPRSAEKRGRLGPSGALGAVSVTVGCRPAPLPAASAAQPSVPSWAPWALPRGGRGFESRLVLQKSQRLRPVRSEAFSLSGVAADRGAVWREERSGGGRRPLPARLDHEGVPRP
jgi:hypothetical protein